jgi:hypothetical protein
MHTILNMELEMKTKLCGFITIVKYLPLPLEAPFLLSHLGTPAPPHWPLAANIKIMLRLSALGMENYKVFPIHCGFF